MIQLPVMKLAVIIRQLSGVVPPQAVAGKLCMIEPLLACIVLIDLAVDTDPDSDVGRRH